MPFRLSPREGFVEVHMYGAVDGLGRLSPTEWELVQASGRILYNFDEVASIDFDPWVISHRIKEMAAKGIAIAGCAERPVWFGVSRQVEILAEASGGAVRAFKNRASAVAWLLHRGPG